MWSQEISALRGSAATALAGSMGIGLLLLVGGEDLGAAVRTVGRTEAVRGPSRTRPF
ncbi:hypothetical protein GCM10018791_71030 [Streptomyces zaomyceticus]|nr:hypothetical protein GCM10018791_71030 [Streptomyces zaomyceticus]